jgi:dethiobiotin synthetase
MNKSPLQLRLKGIFITATDTSVGKTYISCKIVEELQKLKIKTGVFKPISTGDRNDAKALIKSAKINENSKIVTPIFFQNPMSPYGASLIENQNFDLKKIEKLLKYFTAKYDFTVVEGIGGVLVPLKQNFFVGDLIKKFNLPAIIAAKSGLGTLNHTLLTVENLKRKKVKILGIILNGKKNKKDISVISNADIIRKLTKLPVLELGWNKKIDVEKNKWIIGQKNL